MSDNPASRRRILFVDDDAQFLQMIERVMRLWSSDKFEVVTAESAGAALSILQEQPVSLIVVDVCMPVVDGLQFLGTLNRRYPDMHKVVLTGYATDAYRTACLAQGAELFLEKPRTSEGLESIFATLDEFTRFKPEPGFRGVLRRVGLMDVIQIECLGRSSAVLAVTGAAMKGAIYIREGAIIHAEAGEFKGEEAFFQLLCIPSGDFRLNPYSEPEAETIQTQWEALLMDAAQRRDEAGPENEAVAPPPEVEAVETEILEEAETRARIEELVICSQAGDVLHAWQCQNTDLRISLLEFISQKARLLRGALSLGELDRVEFKGETGRLVVQVRPEHGVVLRTGFGTESDGRLRMVSAVDGGKRKEAGRRWFREHLELAGLLAAGIQFPDRSGLVHSSAQAFTAAGVEAVRRCAADTFQILTLQRFTGDRARWRYDHTVVEAARWQDGTCLALVMSRKVMELDPRPLEARMVEFLAEGDRSR